jgi:hypothetical protein
VKATFRAVRNFGDLEKALETERGKELIRLKLSEDMGRNSVVGTTGSGASR